MKGFHRVAAKVDPDAPARTRLMVPKMPNINGESCCWHCTPDAIEPECLIHAPVYRLPA